MGFEIDLLPEVCVRGYVKMMTPLTLMLTKVCRFIACPLLRNKSPPNPSNFKRSPVLGFRALSESVDLVLLKNRRPRVSPLDFAGDDRRFNVSFIEARSKCKILE